MAPLHLPSLTHPVGTSSHTTIIIHINRCTTWVMLQLVSALALLPNTAVITHWQLLATVNQGICQWTRANTQLQRCRKSPISRPLIPSEFHCSRGRTAAAAMRSRSVGSFKFSYSSLKNAFCGTVLNRFAPNAARRASSEAAPLACDCIPPCS